MLKIILFCNINQCFSQVSFYDYLISFAILVGVFSSYFFYHSLTGNFECCFCIFSSRAFQVRFLKPNSSLVHPLTRCLSCNWFARRAFSGLLCNSLAVQICVWKILSKLGNHKNSFGQVILYNLGNKMFV